jgi:hypothetical protein
LALANASVFCGYSDVNDFVAVSTL